MPDRDETSENEVKRQEEEKVKVIVKRADDRCDTAREADLVRDRADD